MAVHLYNKSYIWPLIAHLSFTFKHTQMKTNHTPLLWIKGNFTYLLVALFSLSTLSEVRSQHRVEYYYLYTTEFSPDQDEMEAISAALFDVQAWYQVATGGLTFIISNPNAPIVMALQHNSAYYSSNFVGIIYEEIYNNGGPLDEEGEVIKLFFVKGGGGMAAGANACNFTGGTAWIGMDIFPEFNTGDYFDCPGGVGGDAWPCTPLGAIAHELGHTFSLPHPDTYNPLDIALHSVMQSHWFYPYYYATEDEAPWSILSVERETVQGCPFLTITDILIPQPYDELPVCNLPANGSTPTAEFSYSTNGTEVTFENESNGAFLYYWTFGNGDVSTEENPEYDFGEDGIYDVRLRATGTNGMMDLALVQVVLCNSMVTSISTTDDEICVGDDVTITATGGDQYLWNTGETTSTLVTDPSQDFEYEVTITASNGCYATEAVYIYVDEAPEVEIVSSAIGDAICIGQSVDLSVDPFGEYIWSTGDTDNEINVTPTSSTTYSVTVTNNDGCSGTAEILIEAFPQPLANIIVTDSQICSGDSVTLTASGGTTYLWSNGQSSAQILVAPDTTTAYAVTAFIGAGCEDDASTAITVWPQATASITAPTQVCQGDTAILIGSGNGTWIWSTGDTTSQIQQVIQTDTAYSVTVTTANGCTTDVASSISVYSLSSTMLVMSDDSLCIGSAVELTAPDAAQYLWSTGDTTANISYVVDDTTQVQLIALDSHQCTYGFTSSFYVFPSQQIDIVGPDGICLGDTQVLIVPQDFASYAWSTGSDTSFAVVTTGGLVSVDVVDTFGCSQSDTIFLLPDDTEGLSITGTAQICEGDSATFEATPGLPQYMWSSGQDTNVVVTSQAGIYTLTVTGQFGCTKSDSIILVVDSLPQFELVLMGSDIIPDGLPAESLTYLWTDSTTANVLTITASGLYCLTVTSDSGCSYAACLDAVITADKKIPPTPVHLFPNPFTNEIYIEGEFSEKDELMISTVLGSIQHAPVIRTSRGFLITDTDQWPAGLYIIKVLNGKYRMATLCAVKM